MAVSQYPSCPPASAVRTVQEADRSRTGAADRWRGKSMPSREQIIAELTAGGPLELAVDTSLGWPIRVYKNAPASFREVFQATRAFGDRPFRIYEDETITYAGHFGQVAALARALLDAGVHKGDRVAIGMRNYPEWSVSFWACQSIGAIVVALNAWWTATELNFALSDSTPSALLIDGERLERLRPALDRLDLKAVFVARRGGAGDGGRDIAELTATPADQLPDADVGPADLATILYTSGTTGN